ncbi:Acyl-CoA dehydrogenase, C-terminal:Acyl-CoA dehydrogenase, central region [Cupriavidus taiwanensis]|uniref:Acyl-CoA dehydrogenase, C-terminal:Acyl-CoA dehydrogenase, central region n=1 Tax=Cupriavidus taiwanensis TaxID=164546 RepID=A0A976B0I1_9BURK|nr:acyl-CoA dehydrogenase family protein [Cupriavidus taiwanensis]SOZ64487.1 Acyl-CoA dehydrogenase, C-terminal:Acyl-CoA dehydrogenase, central region [Cupriavidus taiwanensis]SOZ65194.1 Acyl-CoA dehydrogenase, C-terminal:Acyl-CoA dehydrogenase, central region [Cupriavidus taiwanensis]SOZ68834.1 Acyl-CoA dehydrogenase, C-terminal:Acyl-CoA dehydrogenase, central region [Cupriavidus taiwanensis]SPA08272.1 Acyl-CoA dehydrogenase, C-terminal:Acyl-CoA dehydrogenase, central region [Cupriavidus taiwa
MDLLYSGQHQAFRQEIREFIAANLPDDMRQRLREGGFATKADTELWQRRLNARGWGAPAWPKAWGGAGWGAAEQQIFADECACAPAPPPHIFNITMLGPVLIHFGSDAQREYFLPKLLNADIQVCQGFSEPGAGSDLASLKTRAERTADGYLVNGQKIWTSQAHYSDWIFCLVRTDPGAARPQAGISFLLVDLKSPGITVRPIVSIDGRHSLNEVFFDNVRVPAENLVGQENRGWDYAKFLLGHERAYIAGIGRSKERVAYARAVLAEMEAAGRPADALAPWRGRIAMIEADLHALEVTQLRMHGGHADMKLSPMLKARGSEIFQAITDVICRMRGAAALRADTGTLAKSYLYSRAVSVFGGSTEVQKNILSATLLDLR